MSHVREGELHAYLDGALDRLGSEVADRVRLHLAACEDCQSRVEQERDLREEASALLDRAMPREIVAPPFEELLRRAAVGGESAGLPATVPPPGPGTNTRRFPAYKWAWAASLVLALGTGWAIGGGSLDFRDFQAQPLAESASSGDLRDEDRTEPEEFAVSSSEAPGEFADEDRNPAPSVVDALEADVGVRSPTALPSQARTPAAEGRAGSGSAQSSPPQAGVTASVEVREKVAESEDTAPSRNEAVARLADAPAPTRDDAPSGAPKRQTDEVATPRLEQAAGGFDETTLPRATDGQPLFLEGRPILAIVEDPRGGPAGVLQQLANGDSVMFVWSGDDAAEREVLRLDTPADAQAAATLGQALARRTRSADSLSAGATVSGFGRVEGWPTVVRLRRGLGLLTVYGTRDESELRALLEEAGLTPPGY